MSNFDFETYNQNVEDNYLKNIAYYSEEMTDEVDLLEKINELDSMDVFSNDFLAL